MLIYVDPGEPNFKEMDTSEEFQQTLERYVVTEWKPLFFSPDNMVLSVQLEFKSLKLISRFLKKDKLTAVLSPKLTEVIKSEEG